MGQCKEGHLDACTMDCVLGSSGDIALHPLDLHLPLGAHAYMSACTAQLECSWRSIIHMRCLLGCAIATKSVGLGVASVRASLLALKRGEVGQYVGGKALSAKAIKVLIGSYPAWQICGGATRTH
eukprot:6342975-Amphidinium_carterae.1